MTPVARNRSHSRSRGQSMVEFAFVFPIAILIILAILVGAWVFFQSEAVNNGARGGARMAGVEGNLYSSSTSTYTCEAGKPDTIVNAVKKSLNIVPLNMAPLCAYSTTELQQYPVDPTKANIVVDAWPSLIAPQCVTVTVTYKSKPMAVPLPSTLTLQGHSSIPVGAATVSGSSSTTTSITCPAPSLPVYSITTGP
jgi:Flp pilus assembly protein TadG